MKKRLVIYLLMLLPVVVWSQAIEVVKIFADGSPFNFGTMWDSHEGTPPGIGRFEFIDETNIVCIDGYNRNFLIFDSEWNIISTYLKGYGPRTIINGQKYFVLCAPQDLSKILIFEKGKIPSNPLEIDLGRPWGGFSCNHYW